MSANFYVYLNVPNNKALIHYADCPHCNDGKGQTAIKSPYNGKWLGPFNESAARMEAARSGKNLIRWCVPCARRRGIAPGNV